MLSISNLTRATGRLTLLSGLLAFACNLLLGLAVQFNFDTFTQPALIFEGLQKPQAEYFHWGMITDLWGYYLLFAPLVFLVFEKLETPWRTVYAASGIAYVVMGAMGAAILAATGTDYLREFLHPNADEQALSRNNFLLVYHLVNNGIWNLLEMALFGIFMLGAAPMLRRHGQWMYYWTISLGISGILDTLGNTFEWSILSDIGLNYYLFFEPIWAIVLGVIWMRSRPQPS